jgi:membrane-bound serine protease (ClpP class)
MSPELAIILCIAGIVCIAMEVYLPGGVIGFLGLCAVAGAAYVGYQHNSNFGTMLLICGIAGSITASWFSFSYLSKTKEGKKALLMETDIQLPEDRYKDLLGKSGQAACDLRPSGVVLIDGQRYDASSKGEYIEKDSPISVCSVETDHIFVQLSPNSSKESPA